MVAEVRRALCHCPLCHAQLCSRRQSRRSKIQRGVTCVFVSPATRQYISGHTASLRCAVGKSLMSGVPPPELQDIGESSRKSRRWLVL